MPTFRKKLVLVVPSSRRWCLVSWLLTQCLQQELLNTNSHKKCSFQCRVRRILLLLRLKTNPFLSGQGKINANGIWCFCVHIFHFLRMIGLHRGKMTPLLVPPLSFSLLPSWSWHMVSIRGSLLQGAAVGGSLWGALWGHYGNLWGRRAAAG